MTVKKPTLAEQHAEVSKYRTSLESLQAIGRAMLGNPSLEDADGVAFQNQVEEVLEKAGAEETLTAVDGVVEPAAKIELITQDVIQPQLQTVARIEQDLADKIANDTPDTFHTSDQMTAGQGVNNQEDPPVETLENLRVGAESIGLFHDSLQVVQAAGKAGVALEALKPMAVSMLRRAPDITTHLGISLEELEDTQVLGDLTDAVDRVGEVVGQAREVAEQKLQEAEAANAEQQGQGEGSDFTDALFEKTRGEQQSGTSVDEGVNVSSTSSDGTGGTSEGGDAGAGDGSDLGEQGDGTGTGDDGLGGTDGTDLSGGQEGGDETGDAGDDGAGADAGAAGDDTGAGGDDGAGNEGDDLGGEDNLDDGPAEGWNEDVIEPDDDTIDLPENEEEQEEEEDDENKAKDE